MKREGEGLVICVNMKYSAFDKVLEMTDRKVSSQKLTIKGTVGKFYRCQLV